MSQQPSYSQTGNYLTCERVFEVKSTTTVVVLDDTASTFNKIVRRAVEKYWKISPIAFTTESQIIPYLGKREYSFLIKNQAMRIEKRVKGESKIQFNEIALYPGYRTIENEAFHARDAYAKIRVDSLQKVETYLYKLEGLIHAMHEYLIYASQGKVRKNTYGKDLDRFLNQFHSSLSQKTLYVTEEDIPAEYKGLTEFYDHSLTFVSKDELQQLLADERPDAAFLHIHPLVSWIYVIDISSGQILYGKKTTEYKSLTSQDFRNLSKAVGKKGKDWNWKKLFR
ncbi:MAG: hypothetical protein AAF694_06905 [Bacteroidota bacterium]